MTEVNLSRSMPKSTKRTKSVPNGRRDADGRPDGAAPPTAPGAPAGTTLTLNALESHL